ncbi:MAG: gamma-glutamyltransferase [Devosia sp.]|uniref:gamma-glutamyltransferase n=1 Tax=Devosia sp. TaxID=1871048 RepID=UPI0019E7A92A|nr:gamma-glutamyltransferase [Devosia sp.]MBF0677421.1 gamma-glutamyltransferase [Devosia sp.]
MKLLNSMMFALAGSVLLPAAVLAQDAPLQPEDTTAIAEKQTVHAENFMVSSAHPLATQAGYDVLAAGGTAADAAVAVQVMLGLVEPQSSGLGGGAFLLYFDKESGELTTYDAREKAPMAADGSYFLDGTGAPMGFMDAVIGGKSAGVLGTPKLLEKLHADHGKSDWESLLQPAIDTAEAGFEVSQRMADSVAGTEGLDQFIATAEYFLPGGKPIAEGTLLKNPDYAETLRLFAEEGAAPFYTGAIAEDIVAALNTNINPGMLTMEDLAAYEVVTRDPVCTDYRGFDVCGMGPPSSGGLTVGQILELLEPFDLKAMGDGAEARHLFTQASRLAFADRGLYMADPDFVDVPQGLLDEAYLKERSALIDPAKDMGAAKAGTPPADKVALWAPDIERPRSGTSHFVIVDGEGNMISATTTIESGFGNRVMTRGFLLNNEMTDFSFAPETDGLPVANRVEAGKRPRSSMAPTIVLKDGEPVLLTGSPGGANIIDYTALSIIALLDWEMDPQEAIDLPHVINLNGPTRVEEGDGAEEMSAALTALGHEVTIANLNSGLHVIQITEDGLLGAADKRREGTVLGE